MRTHSRRDLLKAGGWIGAGMVAVNGAAALAQDGTLYQDEKNHWGWGASPEQNLPDVATNGPWKNMRAVQQKKVFDIHVHSYETPKQGNNFLDEGKEHARDEWKDYTDQLIASMDRHGIALAALNPAFTDYEHVVQTSYLPHKDRFILSAGWPPVAIKQRQNTPQVGREKTTPQEVAAIYEQQLSNGARFIGETAGVVIPWGLMPYYSMKELHPVIDVILKHDVPVQIHTGWSPTGRSVDVASEGNYETSSHWAEVMGRFMSAFPDVKVILAHTGGQFGPLDGWEGVRLLYSFDNAYCDTAKSPPAIIQAVVQGIGADRVLFGSDWNRPELKQYGPYFLRATYQQWYNLNAVALADLTEDQRDWVLYKSAHKLLKLDQA